MALSDTRTYTMAIDNVAVSAVQDIFSLLAGTANGIKLHQIHLDSTNISPAPLRMVLNRLTATASLGSGGSSPTITPNDYNDIAVKSTAHANDTTPASTSGGSTFLMCAFQWDTVLPFDWLPAPEDRPACINGQLFTLKIPATPTSLTVSGYIVWSESP